MGRLIGLLALLNVVVLAAGLSMEHLRVQPGVLVDFNADKVRLLGRVEREAVEPALTSSAEERGADHLPPAAAAAPSPSRCLLWPSLDTDLLDEIDARFARVGISTTDYVIRLKKNLGWWVYLPPFADAGAMQAAMDAARQKGVKDIAPVRGGVMKNAVSLGAFPTLAKAQAQLVQLRSLGIEGLHSGPRPNSGSAQLTIASSVAETKLTGLAEGWRPGKAPTDCVVN